MLCPRLTKSPQSSNSGHCVQSGLGPVRLLQDRLSAGMTVNLLTGWKTSVGIVVLCASILPVAGPGLAANEDAGSRAAARSDPTPIGRADQTIESLLRLVEQRILADHTSGPPGESAIDAWKQVLQVIPVTDSARVSNALATFAVHLRRRASEEQKAGNTTVSTDMSVFASQAEGLKARSLGSETATVTAAPPVASPPAAPPPPVAPPKFEPLASAMPPITPPPQQPAVAETVAEFYAWRGDLMLAKKDVPAARKYYQLAANAGSARAAAQLVRINNPGSVAEPEAEPEARPQPQAHPHRHRARPRGEQPLGIGRVY